MMPVGVGLFGTAAQSILAALLLMRSQRAQDPDLGP